MPRYGDPKNFRPNATGHPDYIPAITRRLINGCLVLRGGAKLPKESYRNLWTPQHWAIVNGQWLVMVRPGAWREEDK